MRQKLFSDRRFIIMATIVTAFIVLYLAMNVFELGGEAFVIGVNGYMTSFLAIITALFAIGLWDQLKFEGLTASIWAGLAGGFTLWALSECISAVYTFVGQPKPYPSASDFLFICGYLALLFGITIRYRSLQTRATIRQQAIIFIVSAILLAAFMALIVVPIIRMFDSTRIWEIMLSITYPILDLILLVFVFLVFTSFEGDFSGPWQVITVGFIVTTLGDFAFIFVNMAGIYYPGGRFNIASGLTDTLYSISYPILTLGIFMFRIVLESQQTITGEIKHEALPNVNVLVFTDQQNNVVMVSNNFSRLISNLDKKEILGQPLGAVLKLSPEAGSELTKKVISERMINNYPLPIPRTEIPINRITITGTSDYTLQKYNGANLVIRGIVENPVQESSLNVEEMALASSILDSTGVQDTEFKRLFTNYFTSLLDLLLQIASQYGGNRITNTLIDRLNETSQASSWNIRVSRQSVSIPDDFAAPRLGEALSVLLQMSLQYVAGISSKTTVEKEVQILEKSMDPTSLDLLTRFGFRHI